MRNSSSALGGAAHQTVADPIQLHTGVKSIQIGFTDQRLSPDAGSATFWGWLLAGNWRTTFQAALPHAQPLSNNHLLPLDKALVFMHGLLAAARKLTHVAYLRRDPRVPELLGIRRVASQSSLTRFFQGFDSAAVNLR